MKLSCAAPLELGVGIMADAGIQAVCHRITVLCKSRGKRTVFEYLDTQQLNAWWSDCLYGRVAPSELPASLTLVSSVHLFPHP